MKILDLIAHLLYPWKCVFCESVLKDTDICRECEEKLPYTVGDSAMQKFPFIDKCVSPLYYKDKVRASVHRYKFDGCSAYSRRYAALMSDCVENNLDCRSIDVISWIPLSKKAPAPERLRSGAAARRGDSGKNGAAVPAAAAKRSKITVRSRSRVTQSSAAKTSPECMLWTTVRMFPACAFCSLTML